MRKNFGAKIWLYPMPVLIVGTYDEAGVPNAMNAAWGGISHHLRQRHARLLALRREGRSGVLGRKEDQVRKEERGDRA